MLLPAALLPGNFFANLCSVFLPLENLLVSINRFFRIGSTLSCVPSDDVAIPVSSSSDTIQMFEAKKQNKALSGWMLVSIQMKKALSLSEAFLLFDCGAGFNDAAKYSLQCVNGRMYTSVVEVPAEIRSVRLVIQGETISLHSVELRCVPIYKIEAIVRIGMHLFRMNRMRGISISQIFMEKWHQIRKAGVVNIVRNLDSFYDYGESTRPIDYQQWVENYEKLNVARQQCTQGHEQPFSGLVSVVCRFRSGTQDLQDTVSSLLRQTFTNWHFVLIVEGETAGEEKRFLEQVFGGQRAKFFSLLEKDVAESFSPDFFSALPGEYVLFMDVGDILAPTGLLTWLSVVSDHPDGAIWYCDSDRLDSNGRRERPCFRPDWNRELFYGQNYIGNCCLYHLDSLRRWSAGLGKKGALFDFILHLIEEEEEQRIHHIPKVMYHCGADFFLEGKHYSSEKRALIHHFERMGIGAKVEERDIPGLRRVIYPLPGEKKSVSIIIPTRDKVSLLKKCLHSITKQTSYPVYDITVVDNNSVEKATLDYFSEISTLPGFNLLRYKKDFNFAAINNFAVEQTHGEYICLLNNDIEVISPQWLDEMVRYAARQEIGCVGAKLLYADKRVQHGGIICGVGNVAGHAHRYFERNAPGYFGRLQTAQYFSAVTAACLLVRRDVWLEVGGMNEELAVAYNDVDFCLKVQRAGYKNVYTPDAELYHYESLSRGADDDEQKRGRYEKEMAYMWKYWKDELENDPFYNKNLSRVREDFSM